MLEQYSDHPVARQKIVLVSPGYVALELQRLGLNEIRWPHVFAMRIPNGAEAAKFEREKKLQKQRLRAQRSVSTPAMTVLSTASNALPSLLKMVPMWNPNAAMSKVSQGVGFRSPQRLSPAVDSLDLAGPVEPNEDID